MCFLISSDSRPTCYADFGRPLGGPLQHSLLGCLQVGGKFLFGDLEHFLNQLKHFRSIFLPYLHSLLHCHDDILGLVFCAMLGALLHSPWENGLEIILTKAILVIFDMWYELGMFNFADFMYFVGYMVKGPVGRYSIFKRCIFP